VKQVYARHGRHPLEDSTLLDFGCGWGRLSRLFARDLRPAQIFGCDSDPQILEWCRDLPGTFRQSPTRLGCLPFEQRFDLAFAFSVFTHLGPATHDSALTALHAALEPNGLLIVTLRPRGFLEIRASELANLSDEAVHSLLSQYDAGQFVYHPHNLLPIDGEIPYGEAMIPRAYIDKYWTARFDIVEEPPVYAFDPYQVPVVLRRR